MTRIRTTVTFLLAATLTHGAAAQRPTHANTEQFIEQLGALDKRKVCQMQFVASGVLRRIDPAIQQASASRHPSIAAAGKTVMEGKNVQCVR
jgi:hypothetical protein